MFGRRQKEEREELRTVLAELKQDRELDRKAQTEVSKEQTEALRELGRELAVCREQIGDTERQLKRHSEAIEDLLEERRAQEAVIERYEHQIREAGERENMLLALLCRYQEVTQLIEEKLCNMDQQHAEDWSGQLALFKKSLEGERRQCAIEETGRPGEPVDYRYHEILDAEDTEKPELDGRVAYCYRPGCIYHGRVVTKAQIRAYRNTTMKET